MPDFTVTATWVVKLLSIINPSKAAGPGKIMWKVWYILMPQMAPILTLFLTRFFYQDTFQLIIKTPYHSNLPEKITLK